ncbi:Protein CBG02337 [Caenorhabditis briggsae]|uniref:Protein CBG02337 n=1 Tax=Caenorhabditis briggsae TaxID=6238 RepID=A8WUK0_CAEBR|nr:Protein CBG02337 [Caenorhabditis briggsae]CAP24162.2 Protein CBG02337 [Caenorhabditis briggsae]
MENPSSMQKLVQQFGFPYLSTELTPIVGPGDTVNCYCLREILEKYVKFNNCYPRIDNYEYLFRCSTHLRSNRKVNATLTMLKDLQTPLALIRLFDSKELVKHYSDDTEHKKLANMVLLKIRAMKMEEKRQDVGRRSSRRLLTDSEFHVSRRIESRREPLSPSRMASWIFSILPRFFLTVPL